MVPKAVFRQLNLSSAERRGDLEDFCWVDLVMQEDAEGMNTKHHWCRGDRG